MSLIISAFARVTDARMTLTPQLRLDCGSTVLVLLDLGAVVGSNVSFFGEQLGCKIFVEDIYKELDRYAREDKLDAFEGLEVMEPLIESERHELVTVIETLGLRTLHEVRRHTDAGNGCTCCHAEIRDLLEKHTSQLAVAG